MSPFLPANVVYNGIPFQFVTHQEDQVIGSILRAGMVFGEDILNYLNSIVRPGSHILDAGANIGAMSIILAKIQPSATIYCFEPDPLNYSLLNINVELNNVKNIRTFHYALGKKQRFAAFYKNAMNYGDHRTSTPLMDDPDKGNFSCLPIGIHVVNIVEFLKQCLGEKAPDSFDIVKIDTQGDDFHILESCLPLVKDNSTVVIEYCPYLLLRNGTTKDQVRNIINHFPNIEMILPENPQMVAPITREKVLSDFESLSPAVSFYDLSLRGKKPWLN